MNYKEIKKMIKKLKEKIFNHKILVILFFLFILLINLSAYFLTYGEFVSKFNGYGNDNSGVENDTVIIDDLFADYNYYLGLNYTYSSNGTLPTTVNKHLYDDTNLVQTKIVYDGTDIDNGNMRGYVSREETQYLYNYYKVYPINTNGTTNTSDDFIEIELIDTPFSFMPNDKAFNGWITDKSGVTIFYDSDIYVRNAIVPVTYTDGEPDSVEVTFHANWVDATVSEVSSSRSWSTAFGDLKSSGMQPISTSRDIYEDPSVVGLYTSDTITTSTRVTYVRNRVSSVNSTYGTCTNCYLQNGNYYGTNGIGSTYQCPAASYPTRGSGTQTYTRNCTIYYQVDNDAVYDPDIDYYELDNYYGMEEASLSPVYVRTEVNADYVDRNMAGYYKKVVIAEDDNYAGYYNGNGEYQTSGICTNSDGCPYYELVQYYDSNDEENIIDPDESYYYLVTRDTNIVVMTTNMSGAWGTSQTKPFTLTSDYGTDYSSSVTWTVSSAYVRANADLAIENMKINYGSTFTSIYSPSSSTTTSGILYGNYNNVKLGRGITKSGTSGNFRAVIGGSNNSTGSEYNIVEYRLMIESGFYNSIAFSNGTISSSWYDSYEIYMEGDAIYGNDYDRALGDNTNLDVYYCASGSWGGDYYASTNDGISFDLTVKSGTFGSSEYDLTTGIYVGGRYGGTHYTSRKVTVEGGEIYNLIGGPLTASNRGSINDTYMYIKGGNINMITGGAGTTATYGNRIIQVTGGLINYSVFGGSNGQDGSSGDGTLIGTPYVYVGGTAVIGDADNVNNNSTLYGAEAGSVFGIGNGNSSYQTIGSANNSCVVIDNDALIRKNVYAGGNYAAVGIASNTSTSTTSVIKLHGGTVNGNVFGGGNKNGSGDSDTISTINIEITGGTITQAVYGGANEKGVIYGNVTIDMLGGTTGYIYGGGLGGYVNNNQGTFVQRGVSINIGDSDSLLSPTITQAVYGGSAFGTVNGTTRVTSVSDYDVEITVNKGTVNSVFGGGRGDATYTPYVEGDVTLTVNGGSVTNAFGGNDESGMPNGVVEVYLKGGTITNTYGGGNKIGLTETKVYLQGATATNIFGGSNQLGNVRTSNVMATSGNATNIYGGNNEGGATVNSHVTLNGATVTSIYGGGKEATTSTTNVTLTSGTSDYVYGGGKSANVTTKANVLLNGAKVNTDLYGGSHSSGTVNESYVRLLSGRATNIYGGNNIAGDTTLSRIDLDGGIAGSVYNGGNQATTGTGSIVLDGSNIGNIYGGGYSAGIGTSSIVLKSGRATNVFGGSNQSGNVTASNISTAQTNKTISNIHNDLDINVVSSSVAIDPPIANSNYASIVTLDVTITNNSSEDITNWAGSIKDSVSTLYLNESSHTITELDGVYSFNQANADDENEPFVLESGDSHHFQFKIYSEDAVGDFEADEIVVSGQNANGDVYSQSGNALLVSNLYGGNNEGGTTTTTNINLTDGYFNNLYGGGNHAPVGTTNVTCNGVSIGGQLYAGGNAAVVTGNTNLDLINTTVLGSAFGGGNAGVVKGDTNVYMSSDTIGVSAYAGGNGASAIVEGNTNIIIDGTTNVTRHVFGGGNAAATGIEFVDTSSANVYIAGATIGGNVYGGANTSVVHGTTNTYIGYNSIADNDDLERGDILIGGTVFGGGEANESGSTDYDFSFISVTEDILIKIDGSGHDNFDIDDSIFGSGNASSSSGDSYIYIDNYGSTNDIKSNISIQRAKEVEISNSYISLSGAADRTNDFNTELFTISRVDLLNIKNDTQLYLETSANLLKRVKSSVDIGANEVLSTVLIDEDTGEVTKNVDNRIYVLEGKHLNILTEQSLASNSYGDVDGMSFFGMFQYDRNHNIVTALYNSNYDEDSTVPSNDLYYFSEGSYVLGSHKSSHDITMDGFYSNYPSADEEGQIDVKYIEPTPPDSNFYMWTIGEQVESYDMNLVASKYLTLGTEELQLLRHADPNITFTVVGFNYSELNPNVNLLGERDIPRIASSSTAADNNISLVMKTSSSGWMTNGSTTFMSNNSTPFSGTTTYRSENSNNAPVLQFYLYHSKNLGSSGDMGTVTISLLAIRRIDDLTNEAERININISLSRLLFNTNDYEASIASGKHYDLFSTEQVNVTTSSSISAYYSLFVENADNFYRNGYHRDLVSDYVFPSNTKITMIDYHDHSNPDYYYYVVSNQDYADKQIEFNNNGEVAYGFSKFVRIGSTSNDNNYNDEVSNELYYDEDRNIVNEEFVFIIDFSGANITQNVTNKSLLIELRDASDNVRVSVLGPEQSLMYYNLYYNNDAVIDIMGELDKTNIHPGESVGLTVTTDFITQVVDNKVVTDTSFYDNQLGIKITLYDENDNQITGASLLGVSYTLDGVNYYPRIDGSLRLNISERITNVASRIRFNTTDSIAPGNYTMKIESFGSSDGIYYGLESSDYTEIDFAVLDTVYGLKVTLPEKQVIINKETGKTLNKNNIVVLNYKYNSVLNNPNIHISLKRRLYDTVYSKNYETVDFKDYFTNDYNASSVENEYILTNNPAQNSDVSLFLYLKDNLMSGTYKIVLSLYDGNVYIGDVYQYIIIK